LMDGGIARIQALSWVGQLWRKTLRVFGLSAEGSGAVRTEPGLEGLGKVGGWDDPERKADVGFVHGLGGAARTSWMAAEKNPATFWPDWVVKDFPGIGVWTLGYAASPTGWKAESMPLADRSINVLDQLASAELGQRPLIFITHSMGGIIVKQLLHLAETGGV